MISILGTLAIIATCINIWYSYYERVEAFFWNWPAYGLIAIGMFLNHAYANAVMQITLATVSTYGFFMWTRHRRQPIKGTLLSMVYDRYHSHPGYPILATSRMSFKQHIYTFLVIIVISVAIKNVLELVNDISPWLDAISFSIPLLASIQYNYKKVDSWIYFIIADFFSLALAYKAHNWYNVINMILFIVFCFLCFRRWLKCMNKQK